MKKILLGLTALFLCVGLCSCKETKSGLSDSTAPDYSDTVISHDTTEAESSDTTAECTEKPETVFGEESQINPEETDTEAETDAEAVAAETQIDNIYKLPLTADKIRGYVYLTIDDGPSARTNAVLDILEEYNVDATFFFIGKKIYERGDETLRAYRSGNAVGCHSMTHDYASIYQNGQAIMNDISAWEETVTAIIGELPEYRIYRFPGGTTNTAIVDNYGELKSAVSEKGYRSFDWNCANCDKWLVPKLEEQSFEEYLKDSVISTLKTARGPKIMLIHETVKETVDMLPWIIEYIRSEGYEFALLSDFDGEYVFRK